MYPQPISDSQSFLIIIKLPFSAKNMVGGGVLSLSGGIALYANSPKAAVSAMLIVTMWGAIFGYFCLLIGRSCGMSLSGTYRECWERSVGHRGGLAVALGSTLGK